MSRSFVGFAVVLLCAIAAISHLSPSWAGTIIPTAFVWIPCLLVHTNRSTHRIMGLESPTRAKDGPALTLGCASVGLYAVTMWWYTDGRSLPSPWLLGTVFIHQCLIVALPEELFFRGYIQGTLDHASPRRPRVSLVLAALLFALAHGVADGDPTRLITFAPGLLFGYLRFLTGRIWTPVIIHALANTAHHVLPLM